MKQSITFAPCALSASRHIVILFCAVFLSAGWIEQASADDETPSNSVPVTFESFLTNPPVIEHADYEVINPPAPPEELANIKQIAEKQNMPALLASLPDMALSHTNHCTLRLDQTNYILARLTLGTHNGRFGSTEWMLMADTLRLADLRINTLDAIEPAVGDVRWD